MNEEKMGKRDFIEFLEDEEKEMEVRKFIDVWIGARMHEVKKFLETGDIKYLKECVEYAYCEVCKMHLRNAILAAKAGEDDLAEKNLNFVLTAYKGIKQRKERFIKKVEEATGKEITVS